MRTVGAFLALLILMLAPLAVAERGSDEPCKDVQDSDDRKACEDAHEDDGARDGPGHGPDQGNGTDDADGDKADGTAGHENGTSGSDRGKGSNGGEGHGRDEDAMGGHDRDGDRRTFPGFFPGTARHVSFDVDPDALALRNVTVDGVLRMDMLLLRLDETPSEVRVEREHGTYKVELDHTKLILTDAPTANLRFKGEDQALRLVFPDGVEIRRFGGAVHTTYVDGARGILTGHGIYVDGQTITVTSFATYRIAPAGATDPSGSSHGVVVLEDSQYRAALENGRLGASVDLRKDAPEGLVDAYDDVEVVVGVGNATASDPIRVRVSSNLTEGRTFVVRLDPGTLLKDGQGLADLDLDIRYYDIVDAANRTEVVIAKADSLADVLDPTDDGGQPEYWIVRDADGVQVLFSVPHWSIHELTVANIGEVLTQPSVVIGIVAGAGGALLAATVMLWPRRRRGLRV